jgi:hypothetical protein
MPQNKNRSGGFQYYLQGPEESGYDPMDNIRREARVEGWFLRRLFTLKLRTRNAFSLFMMLLFGTGATGFMVFAIYAMITTPFLSKPDIMGYLISAMIYSIFGLVLLVGIALLLNFGLNLGIIMGFIKPKSIKNKGKRSKIAKKKMPKRRKDYK